jgi:hypothetical protein
MDMSRLGCIGLLAVLSVTLPVTAAMACPDLSGTFECPAADKQPPLTLIVKVKNTIEEGAIYTVTYRIMGKDLPAEYEVPPKSQRKAGDASTCDGNFLIRKEAAGDNVRMSLNAQGNFERETNGKIEVVCTKKVK